MTNKEWLELLDKNKICHKCQKHSQFPGRKFCPECLEKITLDNIKRYDSEYAHRYQERRKEIYREKKEKGICIRCSKPASRGLYCYDHFIGAKRHSAEMSQKRKRERHERGLVPEYRKEHGLCYLCGAPVEDPKHHGRACNACALKLSEYSYRQDKSYWKGLNNIMWTEKINNAKRWKNNA